MWNSIQIGDTVIGPGENRKVLLNLGRLPTHTSLELPVFVFRAAAPGPTLLLTAGLHGVVVSGMCSGSRFSGAESVGILALSGNTQCWLQM